MGGLRVEFIARTDVGRKRAGNEDFFLAAPGLGLYLVADGMGGAVAGEVASRLAAESVFREVDIGDAPPEQLLESAAFEAHARVRDKIQQDPVYKGMGTTLVMALVGEGDVRLCHVGDSRAYLFRKGELSRLTTDHSFLQRYVKEGKISPEEAALYESGEKRFEFRNVITQAVGATETIEPESSVLEPRPGDVLLMCSDGLTSMVPDTEIAGILARASSLQEAAESLVARANERGGDDNCTVMLLRFSPEAPEPGDVVVTPFGEIPRERFREMLEGAGAGVAEGSRFVRRGLSILGGLLLAILAVAVIGAAVRRGRARFELPLHGMDLAGYLEWVERLAARSPGEALADMDKQLEVGALAGLEARLARAGLLASAGRGEVALEEFEALVSEVLAKGGGMPALPGLEEPLAGLEVAYLERLRQEADRAAEALETSDAARFFPTACQALLNARPKAEGGGEFLASVRALTDFISSCDALVRKGARAAQEAASRAGSLVEQAREDVEAAAAALAEEGFGEDALAQARDALSEAEAALAQERFEEAMESALAAADAAKAAVAAQREAAARLAEQMRAGSEAIEAALLVAQRAEWAGVPGGAPEAWAKASELLEEARSLLAEKKAAAAIEAANGVLPILESALVELEEAAEAAVESARTAVAAGAAPPDALAALDEAQRLLASGRFAGAMEAARRCEAVLEAAAASATAVKEAVEAAAVEEVPPGEGMPSEAAAMASEDTARLAEGVAMARERGTGELLRLLEAGKIKLIGLAGQEAQRYIRAVASLPSAPVELGGHLEVAAAYCDAAVRGADAGSALAADQILARVGAWLEEGGVPAPWVVCGPEGSLAEAGLVPVTIGGVTCAGTFSRSDAEELAGGAPGLSARPAGELLKR